MSQGNRTVVFDVGGWITLSENLGITQSNLTIAGQTAPGNGIGVRGRKLSISARDIVVRFLRARRGILATEDRDDAMTVNVLDGNANGLLDSSKTGNDVIEGSPTLLSARLPAPLVTTDSARAAYDRVLTRAGVTVPARDQADQLLVTQVRGQTGILIQSERDLVALGVGDQGYGALPVASRPANFDTDEDGMPDAWEAANALGASDPADRNADADGDGYTNLEEYLSSLVR